MVNASNKSNIKINFTYTGLFFLSVGVPPTDRSRIRNFTHYKLFQSSKTLEKLSALLHNQHRNFNLMPYRI